MVTLTPMLPALISPFIVALPVIAVSPLLSILNPLPLLDHGAKTNPELEDVFAPKLIIAASFICTILL